MSREEQVRQLVTQVQQALEERENFRLGLQSRHLKALGLILAIALIASFLLFQQSKPEVETISAPATDSPAISQVVIDVAGKVARPGVYYLNQGSRAVDALKAAGGALPGVSTENINLAHVLVDGEQLLVGTSPSSASSLIDINSADVGQLDQLPGVGPVLAQRIITWRQAHGRFRTVDQIKEVPGVGAATFADLKNLIRV